MADIDAIKRQQLERLKQAFYRAVQSVRDSAKLAQLERLIAANDVDGLFRALGLDSSEFAPLSNAIRDGYVLGADFTSEQLTPIPTQDGGNGAFRFDVNNPEAWQWAATHSSRLVTELVEGQRNLLRNVLSEAVEAGQNPRATALSIVGRVDKTSGQRVGGFIGLTEQQGQWVMNARRELETLNPNYLNRQLRDKRFDSTVRKAIKDEKPLKQSEIANIITRMQARAERYRGEVIGRTESLNALRAGQQAAISQAMERSNTPASAVTKEWDATGDARTREDHLLMEDVKVKFNQPFRFPSGGLAMYPGDSSLNAPASDIIQCRCIVNYRVDFIGMAAKKIRGF